MGRCADRASYRCADIKNSASQYIQILVRRSKERAMLVELAELGDMNLFTRNIWYGAASVSLYRREVLTQGKQTFALVILCHLRLRNS